MASDRTTQRHNTLGGLVELSLNEVQKQIDTLKTDMKDVKRQLEEQRNKPGDRQ
jgi:hypothetical protein